jgi:putative FmdB family regulatory protein
MPIYEFSCSKCGHTFEELILRSGDTEDLECPRCGARQVSRLLSATAQVAAPGSATSGACGPGSFS